MLQYLPDVDNSHLLQMKHPTHNPPRREAADFRSTNGMERRSSFGGRGSGFTQIYFSGCIATRPQNSPPSHDAAGISYRQPENPGW